MTDVYESYPPHVLSGDMSAWIPNVSGTTFVDLAELKADATVGDGTSWGPAFGPTTYVKLGDSDAHWDGSSWNPYPLIAFRSTPPPPSVPTSSNTKAEIVEWLEANGVQLDDDARSKLTKAELLDVVAHVENDDVDDPLAAVMAVHDADS